MTEGAIIAACMVILFACMWAGVSYERTKISVMDEARLTAWQQALQPCSGGDSVMTDIGSEAGNANVPGGMPNNSGSNQYIDPSKTSLGKDSGYVTVVKKKDVTFPQVIGGGTFTMQGKMHMRCNEPKPTENLKDFFKQAFNVAKDLFSIGW